MAQNGIHRATAARRLAQARATLIKRLRRELQARLQLERTQLHGVLALLQGKLELSLRLFLTTSRDACNAIEARDRSFRDSPPAFRSPALFRRAERPRHFFRTEGVMPETIELRLTIPPELGNEMAVLEELTQRVAQVEAALALERQRTGQRVYGRRAVLRQSWRASPSSFEPRRNLRPRIAAQSKWARIEALQRNRAFLAEYAAAREGWRVGTTVTFPPGTYWLHRFGNVMVAPA